MQRNHRRSRALALLLFYVLIAGLTAALSLLFTATHIQADDTGWRAPGSDNATTAGSGGDGFEINPQYAYADDNVSAENRGGLGDSHLFFDFGLSVPPGATVKGIQVRLDWYLDSDLGSSSMSVDLSWDGGASWTSPLTDTVETTVEHTAYLGDATDTWGKSWTPGELADDNFRVRVTCNSDTADKIFYLEYVSVIAYYSPVHHLEVTGSASMTAGGSNVLTVTARDTLGDIAVNYSGAKSLTFSGPGQAPGGQLPTLGGSGLGSPISVTFTDGVSDNPTATTLVAYRSETTTVHVTDGTSDSYANGDYGLSLTVSPDNAASLDLTPNGGSVTAGSPFSVTVTAYDAYGNIATGYLGTIRFTSSDPSPTLPADYTFTAPDNGSRNFTSAVTLRTSGSQTVTATDTGNGSLTDTETWSVTAAAAASLDLTPNGGSVTAGSPFSVTVTAYDAYGNIATGYLGTIRFTSSDPISTLPENHTFAAADNGSRDFTSAVTLRTSGSQTITVTDTGNGSLADTETWSVSVATAVTLDLTPNGGSVTAGSPFTVTVTAYDTYGNIATGYLGTIHFTSSDIGAILPPDYGFTAPDNGARTFAVSLSTSGSQTITVTDTGNPALTDTESWSVSAASIHHYGVTSESYTQTAGMPFIVTVTARDSFGNLVDTDNSTSVTMTSTSGTLLFDGNGNGTFGEPGDNIMVLSSGAFSISTRDTAAYDGVTITATDSSARTGISSAYTIASGAIEYYTVTSNSYIQTAGVPFIATVTACDSFGNPVTTDNSTSVTMTSTSGTLLFDGNGNGIFGEPGDNIMVLSSGAFNISARDTAAGTNVTITATDGSARTGTSSAYTFAAATSIDHYTVTSVSYGQTAGVPFLVTVTACDSFGNPVTTDNSTSVTMTSTSGTLLFDGNGNGIFGEPGDNIMVLSSGAFNISARDTAAGAAVTITATDGSARTGTSSAYTFAAGAIEYYTVTSVSYGQTAGVPFLVTVTACDSFGNPVTTDNSTSVTMTSTSGTLLFDGNGNGIFGEPGDNIMVLSSGAFNISARDTAAGAAVTITATDGNSMTGTSSPYTIAAGAIEYYTVTSVSYGQTAGVPFLVTVTAYDALGNVVETDSSTSVTMTSSSGTLLFDGNVNGTFGEPGDNIMVLSSGAFNISARDTAAGAAVTITATDGNSMTGTSSPYTIAAGAIEYYTVTSDDYSQETTVAFIVTVTAYDAYGNLVPVSGTAVTMSSSPSYLRFDGNGNGLYGEAGDDTGLLIGGILDIQAKANSTTDSLIITASDGVRTGMSEPYTIEDFRCFIATAAYGTPMVDQIQVLRDFRDQYLMKTPAGRWFVSTYYRYSPPAARFIARHDTLRAVVRSGLTPIIWSTTLVMNTTQLQKVALLASLLALLAAAVFWMRRMRHSPLG